VEKYKLIIKIEKKNKKGDLLKKKDVK